MKDIILLTNEVTKENINKSLVSIKDVLNDMASSLGLIEEEIDVLNNKNDIRKKEKPEPEKTLNVNILGNAETCTIADKAIEDDQGNNISEHYFPKESFSFKQNTKELSITNK